MNTGVEIRFHAAVYCRDAFGGNLSHVLIDQRSWKVAYLVVRDNQQSQADWIVPIGILESADPYEIRLGCSTVQLHQFEPFTELELPSESLEEKVKNGLGPDPYAMLEASIRNGYRWNVTPGCAVLYWGTQIEAADGDVWGLSAVRYEPKHGMFSSLVAIKGFLWIKEEMVVPARSIERLEADVVHLSLDSRQIASQQTPVRVPPGGPMQKLLRR